MKKNQKPVQLSNLASRRKFVKNSVVAATCTPVLSGLFPYLADYNPVSEATAPGISDFGVVKSIIGCYGEWAASLVREPAAISFRNEKWTNLAHWKKIAQTLTKELLVIPAIEEKPKVTVEKKYIYDGLEIEELSWQLPYGNATKAVVLKPQGVKRPLPAVLALHDHGGKKYFGIRKVARTSDNQHPLMVEHQNMYYGGKPWANEVAKRGYVVLVHDAFLFASRRVLYKDVGDSIEWGPLKIRDKTDENPEKPENVNAYNRWAAAHENIMARSLLCAGTTWPGIVLAEDQIALDILSARPDVDPDRIGCGGLSGGGLRTVYLGGLDDRIKCAVCVGFMSTWRDFIMNKSFTHTWMTYAPLLPNYLDFPEILGVRAPLPTLVQNNLGDDIYTLSEMEKSDEILKEVYAKAGAQDSYRTNFYQGEHKFDVQMQKDAFEWFDKWLG